MHLTTNCSDVYANSLSHLVYQAIRFWRDGVLWSSCSQNRNGYKCNLKPCSAIRATAELVLEVVLSQHSELHQKCLKLGLQLALMLYRLCAVTVSDTKGQERLMMSYSASWKAPKLLFMASLGFII